MAPTRERNTQGGEINKSGALVHLPCWARMYAAGVRAAVAARGECTYEAPDLVLCCSVNCPPPPPRLPQCGWVGSKQQQQVLARLGGEVTPLLLFFFASDIQN